MWEHNSKTPPRPCSAASSANRGASTRFTEHEIVRLRHPSIVRLSLGLPPPPADTLPQPDSNTRTVSIKTSMLSQTFTNRL